jgi:tetratricopeptide (TPR) repeat protein
MRRSNIELVAEGALAAGSGQREVDDLLLLAVSRPQDAFTRAREIIAGQHGPHEASVAHQAAGIVLRDIGDVSAGVRELHIALRLARQAGSAEREADVLASLGTALIHAGRTADGLAAFDRAIQMSTGVLLGRVLHRRGIMLWNLGRHPAALDDFRRAVSVLQRAGDRVWTARALNGRGLVRIGLGSPGRADADFVAAERLYTGTGQ